MEIPPLEGGIIAMAGRSNVGKSSLLNRLARSHHLARTGRMPGKTTLANLYEIGTGGYFLDLPGYGYMQRGRDEATDSRAIAGRLLRRLGNISRMLLLVDSRRDILESDLQALSWFLSMGLPVSVVITKSDKLNRQEQSRIKMDWMAALSRNPGVDLTPILVSSKNGDGMDLLSAKVSESLYGGPS